MYLQGEYNEWLVVLSVIISIVISFVSLNIATRLPSIVEREKRVFWLIAGAIVMGNGIWAFHFIGMLAFHIPIKMTYNPLLTILSMIFSIAASFIAFYLTVLEGRKRCRITFGSLSFGSGIILMHYTGMVAMQTSAKIEYNMWYIMLSILIAFIASYCALYLFIHFKKREINIVIRMLFASLMGIAISGMHYTGMKAASFYISDNFIIEESSINFSLVFSITGILALILIISWYALFYERKVLTKIAFEDPLTKINNRLAFNQRLKELREDEVVTMLFIDLNNFKLINDTQGHYIGDGVLSEVAQRLIKFTNKYVEVYRFGGDEFIMIVQESNEGKIVHLTERILSMLKRPIKINHIPLMASCNIGIATGYVKEENIYSLVQKANKAMYRAKAEGKSTYSYYDEVMENALRREQSLNDEMDRALQQGQFYLEYEPKLYINGEKLYGVEALLRWEHPRFGSIEPNEFIPIAEKNGMIVPLTFWIIESVCVQGAKWQEKGYKVPISINLTTQIFETEQFFTWFEDLLNRTGFPADHIAFEITEQMIFGHLDLISNQLYRMRSRGIKVIMDDFGVGYSSMNILEQIPLDAIKLDHLFARHIDEINKRSMVQAVVMFAKSLNIKIIAEGVETEKQLKRFKQLGCHIVQGHYFARSMSALQLEEWLRLHHDQ